MISIYSFISIFLLLFNIIALILIAAFSFRYRVKKEIKYFILVVVALIIWSFSILFVDVTESLIIKIYWIKIGHSALIVAGVFLFYFLIFFSGRYQRLLLKSHIIIWFVPVLVILGVYTNENHNLFWTAVNSSVSKFANLPTFNFGILAWLIVVYEFTLVLSSLVIVIKSNPASFPLYQRQVVLLISAIILPFAGTFFYFLGMWDSIIGLYYLSFTLSSILIFWGIIRYGFLNISPIAYDKLFKDMADGALVLDFNNRIVDFNPAVKKFFQLKFEHLGQRISNIREIDESVAHYLAYSSEQAVEIMLERDTGNLWIQLKVSLIQSSNNELLGKLCTFDDITLRKQAEERLVDSEYRKNALIKALPDLIFILDVNGIFIDYFTTNPHILYVPPENFMHKSVAEVLPIQLVKLTEEKIKSTLTSRKLQQYEYSLIISGEERFFESRMVPNSEATVLVIIRDITEQKLALTRLRESELNFFNILNAVDDGICYVNFEGKVLTVNNAFLNLTNLSVEQVINKTIFEIARQYLPPFSMNRALNYLYKIFNYGILEPIETEYNGKFFEILCGKNTETERITFLIRDITARINTQKEVFNRERNYREIFNFSFDALFLLTSDTAEIRDVNDTMLRMYGYNSKDEVCALSFGDLSCVQEGYDDEKFIEMMNTAKERTNYTFEWRAKKKSGEVFWAQISFSRVEISGTFQLLAAVRDITELKLAVLQTQENEKRLGKINQCLINLGPDCETNVNILTKLCGELLKADCALYNRLEGDELNVAGRWNLPPDYKLRTKAAGKVCYDVISSSRVEPLYIKNLSSTGYYSSDPNLKHHSIITYAGHPVYCADKAVGSVCVLFKEERALNKADLGVLSLVASAIGTEEERMQSKMALYDSEQKYRKLSNLLRLMADTMPDMLWAKNLNKEFIFVNKAICENLLNARDIEEPIGKTDLFFAGRERASHPENPNWHTFGEVCVDSDEVTLRELKPMRFIEFGFVKGKYLCLDVHKAPIYDENGKLIGVVGSGRDVTAEKEAEKKLQKLSRVVEQSPASVIITDPQGNIEYVNKKFLEVSGYTNEEIIGRNIRLLKSGKHPAELYKDMWETISSGKDWRGELLNKKKDGSLYWESIIISPLVDDKGNITHYISLQENISSRMELENQINEQIKLREILLEISSEFINIPFEKVDEAIYKALREMGFYVKADRAYIFDYDWENNTCSNTYEWCEEGITPEIGNLQNLDVNLTPDFAGAHKSGNAFDLPNISLLPDNNLRRILEAQGIKSLITIPMMDQNNCIGFVGFDFVKELHASSLAERHLLTVFAQVLVNIKLRKQMVEQIIRAKEKAEEMNKVKSYFFSNMSHELRTPFVGILGFSEILRDELQETRLKEIADGIFNSSLRMQDTLTKILNLTKLESDYFYLSLARFDLSRFIARVFDAHLAEANLKKLSFERQIFFSEVYVETDEKVLKDILDNLISNAIKYTTEGGIKLSADFTRYDEYGMVKIVISDTGIGIPADKVHLIWEAFRQVSEGIGREYEGTGLGLTIVKKSMDLLGGKISLASEYKKGSVFTLEIPVMIADRVNKKDDYKSAIVLRNSPNKRILYVEDDYYSAEVVRQFLAGSYPLDIVRTPDEAIQKVNSNKYNVILMDINLKASMNGIELTKEIRKFSGYNNIPIIAITAYGSENDVNKYLSEGLTHYIAKPLRKIELLQLLSEIFSGEEKKNNTA